VARAAACEGKGVFGSSSMQNVTCIEDLRGMALFRPAGRALPASRIHDRRYRKQGNVVRVSDPGHHDRGSQATITECTSPGATVMSGHVILRWDFGVLVAVTFHGFTATTMALEVAAAHHIVWVGARR
jgi:hypothetical protein